MIHTCLVLAKRPVAGRVKTRLTPPLHPDDAARVAAASLAATLDAVDDAGIPRRVLVVDSPGRDLERAGWTQVAQCAGGLDVRIAHAFVEHGAGATLLVGMDTPQLQAHHLTEFDPEQHDAALGPASDGGYWALALRDPRVAAAVVPGVPMSVSTTGDEQATRLAAAGLRVQRLAELTDIDTMADLVDVGPLVRGADFETLLRDVCGTAVT